MRATNIILSIIIFGGSNFSLFDARAQDQQEKQIKTETMWRYQIIAGKVGKEGTRLSFRKIGKDNRTTEKISYKPDGSLLATNSYVYDSEGKLRESITSSSITNVNERILYTTYENHNIVEAVAYNADGDISIIMGYKYDIDGQMIESISRSPDNEVYIKLINKFDAVGNIVEAIGFSLEGKIVSKLSYSYDLSGSSLRMYGIDGLLIQSIKNIYDSNGYLKEEMTYDPDGNLTLKGSFTYNDLGYVTEEIIEVISANLKTKKIFKYDDYNNLFEQTSYNKLDEPVELIRVVREYYD